MQKVAAPKNPGKLTLAAQEKRRKDILALKNKPSWTPADRDAIIQMLVDAVFPPMP